MARKHDKFSYSGYKYAPEQWNFCWNHKQILLDSSIRSWLAQLILSGNKKKAEDILKQMLRKQEKQEGWVTFGFFITGSKEYYYTEQLTAHANDLQDKLRIYKKWKHYIQEHNCRLSKFIVTSGNITPEGYTEGIEEKVEDIIDLSRPIKLRVVNPEDTIFQF